MLINVVDMKRRFHLVGIPEPVLVVIDGIDGPQVQERMLGFLVTRSMSIRHLSADVGFLYELIRLTSINQGTRTTVRFECQTVDLYYPQSDVSATTSMHPRPRHCGRMPIRLDCNIDEQTNTLVCLWPRDLATERPLQRRYVSLSGYVFMFAFIFAP